MNLLRETYEYLDKMMDYVFENKKDIADYRDEIIKAADAAEMPREHLFAALTHHWYDLVEKALEDDFLSRDEETTLAAIVEAFPFKQDDLLRFDCLTRLAKAAMLRDLMDGKPKSRFNHGGTVPFKLQKNEVVLWITNGVKYEQLIRKRSTVGGHSGVSVRLAKGLYWRVGGFKAKPVEKQELKHLDTGNVILTNKHIMFDGTTKNFRIRLSSLALIEPYSDGLQLQKGTQTALPFSLHPLDGWFHYNAIQNA